MSIGKRIKEARINAGLTQKELAEKAGTATGTIQQYELGKRQPRLVQLEKIAYALETTVSELVDSNYWHTLSEEEARESWEENVPFYLSPEARIKNIMSLMNKEGKCKVVEYASDILPQYRTQNIPCPSHVQQEGTGTVPPMDALETPPESE